MMLLLSSEAKGQVAKDRVWPQRVGSGQFLDPELLLSTPESRTPGSPLLCNHFENR